MKRFPIIPCDLCGSQPTLQRKQVKQMLREWEKLHPGRVDSMFRALSNLTPSHLMDRRLFDFAAVRATRHDCRAKATRRSTRPRNTARAHRLVGVNPALSPR